jgi:hypothetical protein
VSNNVPNDESSTLPEYNYDAASESERWAYDQGTEAGYEEALSPTNLPDLRDVLAGLVAALDRMLAEGGGSGE